MINDVLMTIDEWMVGGVGIAALGYFIWGVVSVVLSPCHMDTLFERSFNHNGFWLTARERERL